MRKFIFFLGLVIYICRMSASTYSNFYFKNIGVDMGLSHNMVYAILQDQQGFMWFGTQEGLNRFDGVSFKTYKKENNKENCLKSDAIFSLMEDKNGMIWIGTDYGVSIYNPKINQFSNIELKTDNGEVHTGIVRSIICDKNNNVWLSLENKGIFCINEKETRFYSLTKFLENGKGSIRNLCLDMENSLYIATYQQGLLKLDIQTEEIEKIQLGKSKNWESINSLCLLNPESLLIGTTRGLLKYDLTHKELETIVSKNESGKNLFVRDIYVDKKNLIWIGTESGGYIYSAKGIQIAHFKHLTNDIYSLSDNAVHSIYQDREGDIWIGTFFGGVNYYSKTHSIFEKHYPTMEPNSIMGKSISEFLENSDGKIWIGTEDKGLYLFDPSNKTFQKTTVRADNIHTLSLDKDKLWIGSFQEGLFVLDLKTKGVKNYLNTPSTQSLKDNNVYSIYKDSKNTTWIGTMTGLHQYDSQSDNFNRTEEETITSQVNDILEDNNGNLWFATLGQGLFSYDYRENKWENIPTVIKEDSIQGKKIICLLEDKSNRLWLGTEGAGLILFHKETKKAIKTYTVNEGLPNNVIYRITEDKKGNIWGSTNYGLFCLNPSDGNIQKYTHADGLLGNQFNYKSGLAASSGKMYFGGIKGFVAFNPQELVFENKYPPTIVFNNFLINNYEISTKSENGPLEQSINYTKHIELAHNQSTFSLDFAVLDYSYPNNYCSYKLEGWDKDWIVIKQLRRITYSNIPPGKYTLRVKSSSKDGKWLENEVSMSIQILPPFYLTKPAFFVYIILIAGLSFFIRRRWMALNKKKQQELFNLIQQKNDKELYEAKITFFTNITHEIRTPLSLIKMPLEDIMKKIKSTDKFYENLEIISKNTDRLLKLVNELLDFRRVEANDIKVSFMHVELVEIIRRTIKRFKPSADIQNILFIEELPDDELSADVDIEIFTKILSNLLNNALKHASSFIRINLYQSEENFYLEVSNDGERIPTEQAERIFEPFVKLDENSLGTGIGLAFVRSLVKSHKGEIYVDTKRTDVTFIIVMPISQPFSISIGKEEAVRVLTEEIATDANQEDDRKIILLVEDNQEFLQFMSGQLQENYRVLKTSNGKDALELLSIHQVDLVISDIMMPVMDGMTLCKEIKENIKFSHIPVILLSAKMDLNSRLDGMKLGADEYIVKPYSIDYLKVRIENLIDNRSKIKDSYLHSPESTISEISHSKADEEFLNKLVENIHQHLSEDGLNVDTLAQMMNMSRATLYRKLKNVSELTPNEFIRLIRLKKAAELLKQKEYRINEIIYIVGFNSVSYFCKCFSKQFGVTPKDYCSKLND